MADRSEDTDEPLPAAAPTPETLNLRKDRKGVLLIGAAMFNAKPKQGLAMLESEGIITPDTGAGTDTEKRTRGIAKFLRHSTRLDKKLLGDYISRPDQIDLLKAFMNLFDFRGVSAEVHLPSIQLTSAEIHCRCHARIARDLPSTRRSAADCSNHRDFRRALLLLQATYVDTITTVSCSTAN